MKTKDFVYLIIVAVLAILSMFNGCGKSKLNTDLSKLTQVLDRQKLLIDTLSNQIATVDTVTRYDTVVQYKTRTVTNTRILPVYDTLVITKIDTVDYEVTKYAYSTSKNGVVIIDSLDIQGTVLSHKQDVVVIDTLRTIIKEVPVIAEKEIITMPKPRLEVWAGTTANGNFRFDPALGFQYKGFGTYIIKPVTPTTKDVSLLFTTKIRFK